MYQELWTCRFCTKVFKRSDVLRRHYTRCPQRGDQPIPSKLQTGRRRKSCDQCVKLKLACDADFPCEACLVRGCTCSGVSSSSSSSTDGHVSEFQGPDRKCQPQSKFRFLLRYIDPSATSLTRAFGLQTPASNRQVQESQPQSSYLCGDIETSDQKFLAYYDIFESQDDILTLAWDSSKNAVSTCEFAEINNQFLSQIPVEMPCRLPFLNDPCQLPTPNSLASMASPYDNMGHALIDELTHFTLCLPKTDIAAAPNKDIARGCLLLLSGKNQLFLDTYFKRWNHHSPIIHRPTFNASTAPFPLLLAILLTGAQLSSNSEDVSQASRMLNLAERYIFAHNDFQMLLHSTQTTDVHLRAEGLYAIQAAFQITQIQLRSQNAKTRENARCLRFTQLITASRNLGLHQIQRSATSDSFHIDGFDWHRFSTREAGIRLMGGIFCLEASFSIFYDTFPRLSLQDMCFDMPCAVDAYAAASVEECTLIMNQESQHRRIKANEAWEILLHEKGGDKGPVSKDFDSLLLFIMILGLLQAMWLLPQSQLDSKQSMCLTQALRRWKVAWDLNTATLVPGSQENVAFFRHVAVEFWSLTSFMVSQGYTRLSSISHVPEASLGAPPARMSSSYNTLKWISERS